MKAPNAFFGASARAMLPLGLWALHFAFSYVAVALGCTAGWHRAAAGGLSLLQWVLVAGSTVAIAAVAALIYHDCRSATYTRRSLISRVRAVTALIALLGIVWASAPPLLLPACHFTDQQPLKAATGTRTFPPPVPPQEPSGPRRNTWHVGCLVDGFPHAAIDQALRAESDGQTDDARGAKNRSDRHTDLHQDHCDRDEPDHDRHHMAAFAPPPKKSGIYVATEWQGKGVLLKVLKVHLQSAGVAPGAERDETR